MRLVERGVGHIEVVVPEFVPSIVAVGGKIKHVHAALAEALVGLLDKPQGGFNGVSGQSGDQEEPLIVSVEALHRPTGQRPVAVRVPPVFTDGLVVGPTHQGDLLVETRLVVPTRNPERDAFCRHEIIQRIRGVAVQKHRSEGVFKMRLEGLPVDGLRGRHLAAIEHKNSVLADVSGRNKGPSNGAARFGVVVDEHTYVTIIQHR